MSTRIRWLSLGLAIVGWVAFAWSSGAAVLLPGAAVLAALVVALSATVWALVIWCRAYLNSEKTSEFKWPEWVSIGISTLALLVSVGSALYSNRSADITAFFDNVGWAKLGGTIIPVTFVNHGGQVGTIEDVALIVDEADGNTMVMGASAYLKLDRLPTFGLAGTRYEDYVESAFAPFSVPAGASIEKQILFLPFSGNHHYRYCKSILFTLRFQGASNIANHATLPPGLGDKSLQFVMTDERGQYLESLGSATPRPVNPNEMTPSSNSTPAKPSSPCANQAPPK